MQSSMLFPVYFQQLEVPEKDKHMYGEVATPYQVIEDMFRLLPSEMFENPDLKWFDPCCGNGFFMEILYNRLFRGLQECFPKEEERKEHIMHNMLYMMDIQEKFRERLKRKGFIHVWIGDMFQFHHSRDIIFDVVLANPPYNVNGKMKVPTMKYANKTQDGKAIWMDCIRYIMTYCLKDSGIGLFITPVLWLRPDRYHCHSSFFSEYSVDKLCVFNCTESQDLFEGYAQTPVCFFTLRHYTIGMNRHILHLYDRIHDEYALWNTFAYGFVIPMNVPTIIMKIMKKVKSYSDTYTSMMLSPIVHKTNMPVKGVHLSSIKGSCEDKQMEFSYANVKTCHLKHGSIMELVIEYSNTPCAFYGIPKIIMAHKMYGIPYLDLCGTYGISNRDNYVICLKDMMRRESVDAGDVDAGDVEVDDVDVDAMVLNAYILRAWLETKLVRCLMGSTRYRMRYLEKWAFSFIPNILKLPNFPNILADDFCEDDIFDYFHFDAKEREVIMNS